MAEPTAREKKLVLILQLLKKAESTTEHEAAAIQEAVARLMTLYSISDNDLSQAEKNATAAEIGEKKIWFRGTYAMERMRIAGSISVGMNLTASYFVEERRTQDRAIVLVGFPDDVEIVSALIRSIDIQALEHLRQWWREVKGRYMFEKPYRKLKERRGYLTGYDAGVYVRIRSGRSTAVESLSLSKELELMSKRQLSEQWLEKMLGELEPIQYRIVGHDGWRDGFEDGQNTYTGESMLSKATPALTASGGK